MLSSLCFRSLIVSFLIARNLVACQRVAIIGEGISGSFTAKYLADYDVGCKMNAITIFEAVPIDGPISASDSSQEEDFQGSRVTSIALSSGINIELGASIGHSDFHLVLDMVRNDPSLEVGAPFTTGLEGEEERSMGIYIGNQKWAFRTWSGWKMFNKFMLILRYNMDLLKISKLLKQSVASFELLPRLLFSADEGTFFESPDEIWDRLGLLPAVHASFSVLLDAAKISRELSYWRKFLPFQGSLRDELLTAINLVNYNQNMDEVNGLVGLGSFAASSGSLFSIKGGNHGIIRSAIKQAKDIRLTRGCEGKIQQERKIITHVVGSFTGVVTGFNLFSGNEDLGFFDVVVLAAPLHQARIEFSVQSHFDSVILQPMPLGGLIGTEEEPHPDHEGHDPLPGFLPEAARRPYTKVVTTIVSEAELQGKLLGLGEEKPPRSIVFTESGKASLHNITAITRIHSSGVYKLFSNDILSDAVKVELFGPSVRTEYTKVWGGPHGGATPAYQGGGESTRFLLYDAAVGIEGHTKSGALYYPVALELSTLACMEISAVGAKAVSKLIARRFGWIEENKQAFSRDEL